MRCSKMSCFCGLPCRRRAYSKTTYCVSGNCWSSSKKYLPPRAAIGRGMRVDAQAPAGDVDVVDAVVAHVAGAEVVPPAPDAVQPVGLVGHHRARGRARGRSRGPPAGRVGLAWPMLRRSWLFQALDDQHVADRARRGAAAWPS